MFPIKAIRNNIYYYDYLANERPINYKNLKKINVTTLDSNSKEYNAFNVKNKLLKKEYKNIVKKKTNHIYNLKKEVDSLFDTVTPLLDEINRENLVDFLYVTFILMYPFEFKNDDND